MKNYYSRSFCFILYLTIALSSIWANEKTEYYVIDHNGAYIYGYELTIDAERNIILTIRISDDGRKPKRRFKSGKYRYAHIPMPEAIFNGEDLYQKKQYKKAIVQAVIAENNGYQYLGYAFSIAKILIESQLILNQIDKAEPIAQKAQNWLYENDLQKMKITQLIIKTHLRQQPPKTKEALPLIRSLQGNLPESKAIVYNSYGYLFKSQGKDQDAVLQFLKTLELCGSEKHRQERHEAYQEIIQLLKPIHASQAKAFHARMQQEFNH